jgi:hypothetical protein
MSSPALSASPSRSPRSREAVSGDSISDDLEAWSRQQAPCTIGSLIETFGPRSFAVLFVVLLALPALPLPTGGLSHVFEAVAMLLALELIIGHEDVWVPRRWESKRIKGVSSPKFVNVLVRRIRWVERFARPRWSGVLESRMASRLFGAAVFGLSLTAFLAPPFSGLDTLPALGVVVISLGMLFGDALIVAAGGAIGVAGLAVVVGLGSLIVRLI